MNGMGSYLIAGATVAVCAGTIAFWTPANTSNRDTPGFPEVNVPAMFVPPNGPTLNPPPPAQLTIPTEIPGGSPLPSVEGNMPSQTPLPGLNTPPRSEAPLPTAPRPTLPPEPLPTPTQLPPPGSCGIGLVLDPILGVCVRL